MSIRQFQIPFALLLLLSCGFAQAAPMAADEYRIDVTISRDGSLIGKPAIVAKAGAEAEVRDENPLKPNEGFRILVAVTPLDKATDGAESVKLDLTFFGRFRGKWIERAKNSVTTVTGRSTSFAFPAKAPEVDGKNYDLVVSINRDTLPAVFKQ